MKRIMLLLFVVVFAKGVSAQGEANIWYFGLNAGVDFNSGSPVALTNGALTTSEGCATICDKNGNLRFYTDGIRVWNRNHMQMPNGFGLLGDPSAAQSGVAVPVPGDKNRYYVFTVAAEGGAGGFCYSMVDMTLNGGLGDVVATGKNTQLFTPSTEKVTAVKHANGVSVWVIAHGLNSNRYYAYLIDCKGLNPPVTSDVGQSEGFPGWGYLTASPDGKKLGSAMRANGFELLDFNNATGVVSNPILLGQANSCYGISFSPNGKVLYGSQISTGRIYQWDLQAGSSAAIIASGTLIGTAQGTASPYRGGAMQIGPDKKIYLTQFQQSYLSVINNPNVLGAGCNLQFNAVNLQGRNSVLGLPGLIQSFFDSPVVIKYVSNCVDAPTTFSVSGSTSYLDSVRWYFGDAPSGSQNTATTLTPTHQFSAAGTYAVMMIKYLDCVVDTVYANVLIKPTPVVNLGNDTSMCSGSIVLQSSGGTYVQPRYQWSTGGSDTLAMLTVNNSGTYWLQVTDTNGCAGRDTIVVTLQGTLKVDLGNDKSICSNNLPLTLTATLPAGTQYIWSTGLTSSSIDVTQTGKYWLYASINGCEGSDTINVLVVGPPVIDAGRDTIICADMPVQIGMYLNYASYKWSNDSTTPFITVSATGDYVLTLTYGPCVVKDTVSITAMPLPAIDLGRDTDLCLNQVVVLNAGNEGIKYLWYNGHTSITDTISHVGKYWVMVTSEYHCVNSDTIVFKPAPEPSVILGNDTTICEEVSLMIRPVYVINDDALRWSDGSTGRQITVDQAGAYYVYATNRCGTRGDTINVNQIFCDIRIPNAFTPDGDGINDILRVLGNIEHLQNFSLNIYNRWGEQVFITSDKYSGWDGNYKGTPCATAVYVYVLQYSLNSKPVLQKGNVTLIR